MKIAVIGAAGTLGSCAAYTLVSKKLADEILMIDVFESALTGHWLDLETVGANEGVVVKKGTYDDLPGTDIVVMTAGAPSGAIKSRSELLPGSIPNIKLAAENINRYAPEAIVITETNPVDPLNYAFYLLSPDRDRRRFIGYSLNDSLRLRQWSAKTLGVSATEVRGTVIGEHGGSQVMLFSTVRSNGKMVEFDKETRDKIRQQPGIMLNTFESLVPRRTAGWTSAYGTSIVVQAIKNDTKAAIPCNAILEGEYGLHNISMTVPVVLGKNGIEEVQVLQLTSEEKAGLENTVRTLDPYMRLVEEKLGSPLNSKSIL
jgi:malate dehydrogenase